MICNQTRWANNGQIENVYEQIEPLLNDSKPTVVRQCLNALHEVVLFRPEMCYAIKKTKSQIDIEYLKETNQFLEN